MSKSKCRGMHVFSVRFNYEHYLIAVAEKDGAEAIRKATEVANKELTSPEFKSCEYVGEISA